MRARLHAYAMLIVVALPAHAQQGGDGASRMERGAQEFLEGLLMEMEPVWRELQGFMAAMGPALIDLMEEIEDWSIYAPPEILDNGDIIIRRKPPASQEPPEPLPQIEL